MPLNKEVTEPARR